MMKTTKLILSGLCVGLFVFNACDNIDSKVVPESNDMSIDVVEQGLALDDLEESIFDEIDAYFSQETELAAVTGLKSATNEDTGPKCPSVSVDRPDDARYPKVVTFDFGTENCEDRFGRMKRGKVIVTVTDRYWKEGAERKVSFEDFFVNDNAVKGTKKYKNEGKNEDGQWYFSTMIDVTVETVEGISWTKKTDKIRTMVAGDNTRNPWDDAFLISGTSSGSSSEGYTVTREITTPVYRERACRFPISGTLEIVRTKGDVSNTVWLDYGETCDNKATITNQAGEVKEIMLGKRFRRR